MKKLTDEEKKLLVELNQKYKLLSDKREKNVNRYIIPVESAMEKLRLRIDSIEFD